MGHASVLSTSVGSASSASPTQRHELAVLLGGLNTCPTPPPSSITLTTNTHSHKHILSLAVLYGAPHCSPICTTLLIDWRVLPNPFSVGRQCPLLLVTFTCTCYHLTQTHLQAVGVQLCINSSHQSHTHALYLTFSFPSMHNLPLTTHY